MRLSTTICFPTTSLGKGHCDNCNDAASCLAPIRVPLGMPLTTGSPSPDVEVEITLAIEGKFNELAHRVVIARREVPGHAQY
jgi:hypothetical protein